VCVATATASLNVIDCLLPFFCPPYPKWVAAGRSRSQCHVPARGHICLPRTTCNLPYLHMKNNAPKHSLENGSA
jgi:hypothetical protein